MRTAVIDIETDGLLDELTKVWCICGLDVNDGGRIHFFPYRGEREVKMMIDYLKSFERLIIHNGIEFDLPALLKVHDFEYQGEVLDTLIQSRMQNPNRPMPPELKDTGATPHSLQTWGYRVGRGKVEHEDWTQYSEAMLHRCQEDVEILYLTYKELMVEAAEENWVDAVRLTCRLMMNLKKQEQTGFTVDKSQIDKCLYFLDKWMVKITDSLEPHLPVVQEILETKDKGKYKWIKKPFLKNGGYSKHVINYYDSFGGDVNEVRGPFCRLTFRKISLDKRDEVKKYLMDQGWKPEEWNVSKSTGKRTGPKLSIEDKYEGVKTKAGKLAAKYIQCKQRRGVVQGWKDHIRPDGKISPIVRGFTVTYRARHAVIVNVPRPTTYFGTWMRKCFIPREGWKLIGVDAASCQARMLAARMGDPDYIKVVTEGDMHAYHMKALEVDDRNIAKPFYYAMIFGASDGKLSSVLKKKGKAAGTAAKEKLMKRIPALGDAIEELEKEWKSHAKPKWNWAFKRTELANGWVTGVDGRRIYIPSKHTILVNTLQADEAVMMAVAYNVLVKRLTKKGLTWGIDYAILLWSHDEFQIECRPELTEEIGNEAASCIKWAGEFLGIACPQEGAFKVGDNWADTH